MSEITNSLYSSKVKLIAVTQPRWLGEKLDADYTSAQDLISYCARVSNPKNQDNFDTAPKLLKYMVDNKHWSPFEMVNIVMEIETTRDIGRQILRHRSFSFQEFSQRYALVDGEAFELSEARIQDTKNRQNSIETDDEYLQEMWENMQEHVILSAIDSYEWAIEKGIAKEVARKVLPEGLTPTRMYMNGTLRSWIHYCQLRMGNGTQKEHQEIAKQCWDILKKEFEFLETLG